MKNLLSTIKAFWVKIPNAVKSGWITAWITFTGALLSILTGLLPELANAISSKNFEPFYDSLSLGAAAVVSTVTAFVAGLVNAVYRWLQPIQKSYQIPRDSE